MVLKAVFLDLDDTLVATSVHDVRAFAAVTALAASRSPGVDQSQLLAEFKGEFKRVPWDPDYKVEVTAWRGGLWAQALEKQGVADAAALGDELQAGERERSHTPSPPHPRAKPLGRKLRHNRPLLISLPPKATRLQQRGVGERRERWTRRAPTQPTSPLSLIKCEVRWWWWWW
jgi:FMN phosphatase YigB (HAD superfamily)